MPQLEPYIPEGVARVLSFQGKPRCSDGAVQRATSAAAHLPCHAPGPITGGRAGRVSGTHERRSCGVVKRGWRRRSGSSQVCSTAAAPPLRYSHALPCVNGSAGGRDRTPASGRGGAGAAAGGSQRHVRGFALLCAHSAEAHSRLCFTAGAACVIRAPASVCWRR